MGEAYLSDMDGELVRGSTLVPGANEFIRRFQRAGVPFLVLTNNSLYTHGDLQVRLHGIGLDVPVAEIALARGKLQTVREDVHSTLAPVVFEQNGTGFALRMWDGLPKPEPLADNLRQLVQPPPHGGCRRTAWPGELSSGVTTAGSRPGAPGINPSEPKTRPNERPANLRFHGMCIRAVRADSPPELETERVARGDCGR